MTGEGVQQQH